MTKTIEIMWKEGFTHEVNLTAPKINDLYNRKSQNIVDKLQSMFALNIKAIIIGSAVMLAMMSLIGAPFLGLYICLLLIPLILIAKKELKKSFSVSKGESSYDYIVGFNCWLKTSIAAYARYYKVFYPMFFLGLATQAVVSDAGGKIISLMIEVFPTNVLFLGLPYYLIIALSLLLFIVVYFAEAIYQWDLNIVYGRQFKKLEELIDDMEELRR